MKILKLQVVHLFKVWNNVKAFSALTQLWLYLPPPPPLPFPFFSATLQSHQSWDFIGCASPSPSLNTNSFNSHQLRRCLLLLQNVLFRIDNCICLDCWMYFSKILLLSHLSFRISSAATLFPCTVYFCKWQSVFVQMAK